MVTSLFYHELFEKHELSPGHPESPERLKRAMASIKREKLFDSYSLQLITPKQAELDALLAIHDENYLKTLHKKSSSGGGFFTLDTSSNSYTYSAALLAAGAGIDAVERVSRVEADNAFLLCRPPGHHAESNRAFGFCFINNIAVAAAYLIANRGLSRILIVDYDAHHGNGTQNAFYDSKKVLYVGLHQDGRTLFPGSGFVNETGTGAGEGYTVNLPMCPGAGNLAYKRVFQHLIEPISMNYEPEFVLVSCGFDCHFQDPLTALGLTHEGICWMNSKLFEMAEKYSEGRLVYFLEGGYNLDVMEKGVANTLKRLLDLPVAPPQEEFYEHPRVEEYTNSLIETVQSILERILL